MPPTQNPGSTPPVIQPESVGPVIGAVIIVAMLGLGALYFWGKHLNEAAPVPYIPGDKATQ